MKTTWQAWVYGALFGLALDFALAYIAAKFFTVDPGQYFWLYAALIILSPVPLGLWALIKRWAYFGLLGKESAARIFLKEFHRNKFPSTDGEFDIDQYLADVIKSEIVSEQTKLAAASLQGQIVSLRAAIGFSGGMMATIAAQNAMQRYHPSGVHSDELLKEGFFRIND